MAGKVYIKGAFHSNFGKLENENVYTLFEKSLKEVVKDAQIDFKELEAVYLGNFSGGGFNKQEHLAPFAVNAIPELRNIPTYRMEAACASGSSALHNAIMAVQAGKYKTVAVVGLEKMTHLNSKEVSDVLAMAGYWPDEGEHGFNAPCMFATYANGYKEKYKVKLEQLQEYLACIASKNYTNAAENPVAQMRKPRTMQEILDLPVEKNPIVQNPLRLHDCSLISDGAAALVISSVPGKNKVVFKGYASATDYLDIVGGKRSAHFLEGAEVAVKRALSEAGLKISDINLAEVHDCFTITELLIYSALGIAKPGREFEALEDRTVFPGGKCVVNASGGLKAKGHPVGATGISMNVHLYNQLINKPLGLKVDNAQAGIALNIGGSGASNFATILAAE